MKSIEISNTQFEMLENLSQGRKTSISTILDLALKHFNQAEKSRQALLKTDARANALTEQDTNLIDEIVSQERKKERA
jgi:hypothetical protein